MFLTLWLVKRRVKEMKHPNQRAGMC